MSDQAIGYGDERIDVECNMDIVDNLDIGATVESAVITFTSPSGLTFDRTATATDDYQAKYTIVAGDWAEGAFYERGQWRAQARFTLTGGRVRGSLNCETFKIV